MNTINELQPHILTFAKIKSLGLKQKRIAKELNVTQQAISLTLAKGENPGLLNRVNKFIARYERVRSQRKRHVRDNTAIPTTQN